MITTNYVLSKIVEFISLLTKSYRKNSITEDSFSQDVGNHQDPKTRIIANLVEYERKRIKALDYTRTRLLIFLAFYVPLIFISYTIGTKYTSDFLLLYILDKIMLIYIAYTISYMFLSIYKGNFTVNLSHLYPVKWYNPLMLWIFVGFALLILTNFVLMFFLLPIFASFIVFKPINLYSLDVQQNILPDIIYYYGNYEYKPTHESLMLSLDESLIIPEFDEEESKDYLIGSYKDSNITLFYSYLTEYQDITEYEINQQFKGIVINITLNKNFKGKTVINLKKGILDFIGQSAFKGISRLDLEATKLTNKFEIFSTNKDESRNLLTTQFLEELLLLVEIFKGKKIQCSIYNDKVIILIDRAMNIASATNTLALEGVVNQSKEIMSKINHVNSIIDMIEES